MRRPSVLRLGMLLASVVALFGSLFFSGTAQAATCTGGYPAGTCSTALSASVVGPGGTLSFQTQAIFDPGETVNAVIHSTPVAVGSFTANSKGAVAGTVTVPADLPAGAHELILTGATSGVTSTTPFTVAAPVAATITTGTAPPSSSLPFTGAVVLPLVGAAAGLLIAGSVLLLVIRRRKPTLSAS